MKTLLGAPAFELLKKNGIPVVSYRVISSAAQASKLRVPCVLKVPSVLHKTETGAVKVIHSHKNSVRAWRMLSKQGTVIWQPLVEGKEVIIGLKHDPTFGRVVMFGHGGIFTEVLKEVSFRVAPITSKDAQEMISEIKGAEILKGARGQKPVNIKLLKKVLVAVSKLKEHVAELDINPFIVSDKVGYVVDARIVLRD